ncbi:hypothetical protein T4A_181 [Trichinella pseudospiralis]|uniref:Uncharacterized protein n=2 Tax=Trichinella pseudospiralis TaxID=6337 RepID=A0A0V1E1R7_TRIPS|nr:hypothetical protein T4A_181 [Trichinella pseudospiralis]
MCPVFLTKHQNLAQQFRKAESKRVSAQIQTANHLFMPRQRNSNQRQEIMELKAFKQYGCLPLFDFDEFKVDEWVSDLHSIASKCEFPSHCCGDGETIRLLGQVIFGVNNDDKWHLEQASQLKHDDVGSHHRAALSAIGICSAKAPSSNTSTPQRQATNVIKDKRQSTTGFWNYDGVCRPVKGPPYHFKLRDGVVPSAVKSIGPHWTAHTLFKRIIHKVRFCTDSDLLKAVRLFSSPTAVSGLRAFFSLCQEVRNLSNKVASVLKSLTCLLKNSAIWE